MRALIIELSFPNPSLIAELTDGGVSLHEATRHAKRSSRKKLASAEQASHIDGLEVSESTWGDWDQAYEECSAQIARDRLLAAALHPEL